eukprot:TRINITY_DN18578_c0_g1_i1.p1 TRINITY_DN18578_c0_g1~~TRINITY_DN18578_c0_g1_i1.p1  ORF type:complete len:103 (+),score=15.92 TRINITY_DN18578_c0_g1_i1:25-309(+)
MSAQPNLETTTEYATNPGENSEQTGDPQDRGIIKSLVKDYAVGWGITKGYKKMKKHHKHHKHRGLDGVDVECPDPNDCQEECNDTNCSEHPEQS